MSVLVFTENWDRKFKKLSFELVSYARGVADLLNTSVLALSVGPVEDSELMKLGQYGASRIISIDRPELKNLDNQAWAGVIAAVALKEDARVLILSNNNTGKAIAPRLSVKLKAGVGAGVSSLPVSTEPFTVNKRAFSGNALAQTVIRSEMKILTLLQNSYGLCETENRAVIEKSDVQADTGFLKTEVLDVQKQTGKILLTDADIVVSGGRGMKSPDNWGPL
ncbi:MAG TPA: hypothetical protein P5348_09960, partial [Bacteroidales bacterium]|nr:hypothetical protein [Bacteroidales bacterium]